GGLDGGRGVVADLDVDLAGVAGAAARVLRVGVEHQAEADLAAVVGQDLVERAARDLPLAVRIVRADVVPVEVVPHAAGAIEHDHHVRGDRLGLEGGALATAEAVHAVLAGRAVVAVGARASGGARRAGAALGAVAAGAALVVLAAGERVGAGVGRRIADLAA